VIAHARLNPICRTDDFRHPVLLVSADRKPMNRFVRRGFLGALAGSAAATPLLLLSTTRGPSLPWPSSQGPSTEPALLLLEVLMQRASWPQPPWGFQFGESPASSCFPCSRAIKWPGTRWGCRGILRPWSAGYSLGHCWVAYSKSRVKLPRFDMARRPHQCCRPPSTCLVSLYSAADLAE
jgi:hypothetical protein